MVNNISAVYHAMDIDAKHLEYKQTNRKKLDPQFYVIIENCRLRNGQAHHSLWDTGR